MEKSKSLCFLSFLHLPSSHNVAFYLSFRVNIETFPALNHRILKLPVDWLKDISLVDTPGTNAIFQNHQQITEHFLPRADLVLWVTSIDRAFSESERKFLEHVKQYQKKVVIILSKIDFLEDASQLVQIQDFIRENFSKLTGSSEPPIMFPVSSKLAIEAKSIYFLLVFFFLNHSLFVINNVANSKDVKALQSDPKWVKSAFGDLESYILQILGSKERTMLKLLNPVGLASHFLDKYTTVFSLFTRSFIFPRSLSFIYFNRKTNNDWL